MRPDPVARMLETETVVVLDGGLATELEARGADLRDRLWSAKALVQDPDLIRGVHAAYFDAGADVAISASYQASFEGFAAHGIDRHEASALLRRSVELARDAADATPRATLVAASVGPFGAVLADGSEYTGDYGRSAEELAAFHLPRLEALAGAEPDLFAVETIPSIVEAEALLRVLDQVPEVPAWVSFTCRNAMQLCDGTPFERAVDLVTGSPGVVAVGVNCTAPTHVLGLTRIAAARTPIPVVVYPNRGAFWDAVRKVWVDPPGQDPTPRFRPAEWVEAGARLVGGCCGTGPADIRAMAAAIGRAPAP